MEPWKAGATGQEASRSTAIPHSIGDEKNPKGKFMVHSFSPLAGACRFPRKEEYVEGPLTS